MKRSGQTALAPGTGMNCPAQPDLWWMGISCVKGCRLVLVIVAIGIGVCCHRPPNTSRGVTVDFEIKPKPVRVGPVVICFTLTDAVNHPMAGDWVILLHGALRDGEKLERQFDVRDVRPN